MEMNDGNNETVPMKCRKCRIVLLNHPEVRIEDGHGNQFESPSPNTSPCKSDVWYIAEECMPDWMKTALKQGEWVSGKINCPKCNARIGSYNFVAGMRCSCRSQVVPPIHIVKSKVDFTNPLQIITTLKSHSSNSDSFSTTVQENLSNEKNQMNS